MSNTQTAGLNQAGSNISGLKKDISAAFASIREQKATRTSCNEEISALRAGLEAKGIKKKAFDMAMKVAEMDPDDREGFDIAYDICREALGTPYNAQGDLFSETKEGRQAAEKGAAAGEMAAQLQ